MCALGLFAEEFLLLFACFLLQFYIMIEVQSMYLLSRFESAKKLFYEQ